MGLNDGNKMTPQQQKEEISKAYVAAIAAKCSFKLGHWSQDDDCLDVTIGAAGVVGTGTLSSEVYQQAIDAHANASRVQVTGTLRRNKRKLELQNPGGFTVFNED